MSYLINKLPQGTASAVPKSAPISGVSTSGVWRDAQSNYLGDGFYLDQRSSSLSSRDSVMLAARRSTHPAGSLAVKLRHPLTSQRNTEEIPQQ